MIQPHLWADDLEAMIEWYRTALGFAVTNQFPPADRTWVTMTRGDASIMISVTPRDVADHQQYLGAIADRMAAGGGPISLYLHVTNADDAFRTATAAGATVVETIWDAWWGGRQFTIADPNDILWTVFQTTD